MAKVIEISNGTTAYELPSSTRGMALQVYDPGYEYFEHLRTWFILTSKGMPLCALPQECLADYKKKWVIWKGNPTHTQLEQQKRKYGVQ